jgi:hypothetical protein
MADPRVDVARELEQRLEGLARLLESPRSESPELERAVLDCRELMARLDSALRLHGDRLDPSFEARLQAVRRLNEIAIGLVRREFEGLGRRLEGSRQTRRWLTSYAGRGQLGESCDLTG